MTASYTSLLAGTTSTGLFTWRGGSADEIVGRARSVGWRPLSLDTGSISSVAEFYDAVVRAWGLSAEFGRSLDALFDTLAEIAATPTILVWGGVAQLGDVDPVLASAVVDVFRDAAGQADTLAVIVLDDLGVNDFDGLL